MKTSREGIELIKQFEGCRLTAYQDSVGVWTIGYGHTAAAGGLAPKRGLKITQQDADDMLVQDLVKYEAAVDRSVNTAKVSPSQAQFDAMVSLCYNIGPGAFAKSSVARHFSSGNALSAANAFLLWNKAGGKVLKGLERRREAERALFLKASKLAPQSQAAPEPQSPVSTENAKTDANPAPQPNVSIKAVGLGVVGFILALIWAAFGAK